MTRKIAIQLLTVGALLASSAAHAGLDVAKARDLAGKNACLGCHAASMRLVGPAYKDVAAKYGSGDVEQLGASIKAGGKGKWGSIAMPAQPSLSDADARLLAAWVLAGSPEQ